MYKKIFLIAIAAVSIIGCRKDPSNVAPTDILDNAVYPKTVGDLETFLTPGYSNFRNANLYGYLYLPLVLSSDHTFCSQNSTGNPLTIQGGDFLTNNVQVTNTPNAALYSQLYQGVGAMNVFFERARYYEATYGSRPEVEALKGQAYFLRAYYFYLLESFYGEAYIDMKQPEDPNVLGIPLPTDFATLVAQTKLPRSSAFKVWEQIIADLKISLQSFDNAALGSVTVQKGRVDTWATKAMLGKVFVFTKQYDSAKVYLSDVINNSGKSLMAFSQYKNAFNGDPTNEFNSESLFEINVDRQADKGGILFSSNFKQSLTTNAGQLFAPTIINTNGVTADGNGDGNGGASANMGNNYCKYFVHDKNLKRFGFDRAPYTYMANPIPGPNSASHPAFVMDNASRQYSLDVRTNGAVDPRLFVCAMEPWIDSCRQPYNVAKNVPPRSHAEYPDTIPVGKAFIINTNRSSYWGWSFKKFATIDDAILAYGGNDASNLYLLRLADVYLLYAEACKETGDNSNALKYINLVNTRAYGGSTTHNYATLTSPTKAVGANDELANDPLKYERYVELFGEGGWWFDVCRWGIGQQEASYYVYGSTEFDPATNSGPEFSKINPADWSGSGTQIKAQHLPIPNIEMTLNTAIQRNNYPY